MKDYLRLLFWLAVFGALTYWMGLRAWDSWHESGHQFGLWVAATAVGWLGYKAWRDAHDEVDDERRP
jgi:hypothetical protein